MPVVFEFEFELPHAIRATDNQMAKRIRFISLYPSRVNLSEFAQQRSGTGRSIELPNKRAGIREDRTFNRVLKNPTQGIDRSFGA